MAVTNTKSTTKTSNGSTTKTVSESSKTSTGSKLVNGGISTKDSSISNQSSKNPQNDSTNESKSRINSSRTDNKSLLQSQKTSNTTKTTKKAISSNEYNGDGRLPLFILVHPDFHNQIPPLLQKLMNFVGNTHQIVRIFDSKLLSNSVSGVTDPSKFYLSSQNQLYQISDSLYQETIISSSTNTINSIHEGYISWGNANVALENIFLYRGRMKIIVIVLTDEANQEWLKVENHEIERYKPSSDLPKKKNKEVVDQLQRDLSPSDYELVKLNEFPYISSDTESDIINRLLWIINPEMMTENEHERLVRGHYLDSYVEKIQKETSITSPEEYVSKEIMIYLSPLLKRVAECFQASSEGRELTEEEQRIASRPLLFIGEQLNIISKNKKIRNS